MRSWRSTFIAAVAIPTSVVSAFGMMWALNFTLNSVTMLRPGADGRHRHRRRHRRPRERVPLRRGKEDAAVRGRARGDRRHRAGRHGDDVLAGRHLRAGLVHVLDLRAVPLPVRSHRRGVGAGQPARVVLADADDVRAPARTEDAASGHAAEGAHAGSRGGFYAWIDRAYTWSLALSMRHRWVIVDRQRAHLAVGGADLSPGQAGVHPERRRRVGVRGAGLRSREHEPGRDGRGDASAGQGGARDEGRGADAGVGRRELPEQGEPGLHVRAHRVPRGAHADARASLERADPRPAAGRVPGQLHASAK